MILMIVLETSLINVLIVMGINIRMKMDYFLMDLVNVMIILYMIVRGNVVAMQHWTVLEFVKAMQY